MQQPQGQSRGPQPERRRVSREEGKRLLLAAAMDVARSRGQLAEGVFASADASRFSRQSVALCQADGRLISRVSLSEARRTLAFRRQVARRALQKAGVAVMSRSTAAVEKQTLRLQPESLRALAWAISAGRRFPVEPSRRRQRLTTALLLLCCLLPGLIYWRTAHRQRLRYQHDLDNLVRRWRTMGHPDPADSFFALYDL